MKNDKRILIYEGGVHGGKATIELWDGSKLIRGMSLNPENISTLPDQLAILTRDWFKQHIQKDISFSKSDHSVEEGGFTESFKQEVNYRFKIKIFKLEIILR